MTYTSFARQASERGIFMRYSYEFKVKCVETYERGEYLDIPSGITTASMSSHMNLLNFRAFESIPREFLDTKIDHLPTMEQLENLIKLKSQF